MATATQFCSLLMQAVDEKWGYVWSLEGQTYTPKMSQQFVNEKRSVPSGHTLKGYWQGTSWAAHWYGQRAADCSGLLTWALRQLGVINKRYNSSGFRDACAKRGKVKDGVPNVDGIILWKKGHIAVLSAGKVLEAKSTKAGVVYGKTSINSFTEWGYLPWIDYKQVSKGNNVYGAKTTGNVNMRQAPNTEGKVIQVISSNQMILAQEPENGWSLATAIIDSKFYNGYICAKYIQKA